MKHRVLVALLLTTYLFTYGHAFHYAGSVKDETTLSRIGGAAACALAFPLYWTVYAMEPKP